MTTPQWIDALLWRFRWYRRRVMKRSAVWTALMTPANELGWRQEQLDYHPGALLTANDLRPKLTALFEDEQIYWDTPAILTRGPRSFLEPRRVGSWPLVASVCRACSLGDHGVYDPITATCSCPCHGKGAK